MGFPVKELPALLNAVGPEPVAGLWGFVSPMAVDDPDRQRDVPLPDAVEAIRRLQAAQLLEQLPDKLQETAALRLEYPELSLSELAAEFDPPVSKSCLNHRLRKLLELAKDLAG